MKDRQDTRFFYHCKGVPKAVSTEELRFRPPNLSRASLRLPSLLAAERRLLNPMRVILTGLERAMPLVTLLELALLHNIGCSMTAGWWLLESTP